MLTAETLTPFVGGDIEVQVLPIDGGMFPKNVLRGPLANAEDSGSKIVVHLEWAARSNPREDPGTWRRDSETTIELPEVRQAIQPDGHGRMVLRTDERMFVIFPPDGSKLDPEKVKD